MTMDYRRNLMEYKGRYGIDNQLNSLDLLLEYLTPNPLKDFLLPSKTLFKYLTDVS